MDKQNPKNSRKRLSYSICVSGAAYGPTVMESSQLAYKLGETVAKLGETLTTGATVGLPYYAARGASDAGGMSIGFSPAVSLREHLRKYRLPFDCYDFINFTGMHYTGRDLYLVQSSDAVITVGGRFGSLHEFTSALEYGKFCGVLTGSGGAADHILELVKTLDPAKHSLVVYSSDPVELVKLVTAKLDEKYADIHEQIEKYEEYWFLNNKDSKPFRSG
ncbi:MAG TPA: hypothetical protein VMR34_02005 [Candidatus Saccharimonadales bacterium]|nr:hypothetical protein [Candidatus Saccharimonadales bacterium]